MEELSNKQLKLKIADELLKAVGKLKETAPMVKALGSRGSEYEILQNKYNFIKVLLLKSMFDDKPVEEIVRIKQLAKDISRNLLESANKSGNKVLYRFTEIKIKALYEIIDNNNFDYLLSKEDSEFIQSTKKKQEQEQ
jgi:hypothetical protein